MALADEIGGVSWIGVTQFCGALRRATLHGARDDQGAEGEALWELYEALEQWFPPMSGGTTIEIPRRTVDEVMVTVLDLLVRGAISREEHEVGLVALRKRLTAMSNFEAVFEVPKL